MERSDVHTEKTQNGRPGWVILLLKYGIPLFISVGLCYVLFSQVSLEENIEVISNYCNFWWIGVALALSALSNVIRALRWRIQLRALDIDVPLINVIYSIFGTYAVNLVLPRLGEIWRSGYIAGRQDVSFTKVFGSMLSDRLADLLVVLVIFLATLVMSYSLIAGYSADTSVAGDAPSQSMLVTLATSPWVWGAGVLCLVLAIVAIRRYPHNKIVRKVMDMWHSLWDGFTVILKMRGRGMWLLYTVLLWSCYFVQLYAAFYSFDFTRQILVAYGTTAVLVCFVLTTIANILPSNGGVGPWQVAMVYALTTLFAAGITLPPGHTMAEMAIGFANCVIGTQTLLVIACGLITFVAIALEKRRRTKV